jgi:hypothetical protein
MSRSTSVISDSDPFEYDMSNRAQLPEGIENIRPHLETMDNVPLLVKNEYLWNFLKQLLSC